MDAAGWQHRRRRSREADHDRDHRSSAESGVSDLLACARLRAVCRQPAWTESLQRRPRDHELHAAARRVGDVPLSSRRARGASAGRSHQSRVRRVCRRPMIHIGLVGAGNISDTHAGAVSDIAGASIAAVYSRTCDHAERLAARHQATPYDALGAFLDHRPLDMVIVGSPSGLHADHGIAAAERGLHVLVEKPIDVTSARADALVAAASRARVALGVICQDRVKPDVRQLKAPVDAGSLGRPILATARVPWYRPPSYYQHSDWRGTRALDGGGALMNQGVHTVDLLMWLFGPVRRVFG